ncbi:conserved hypothetical protein [Burkholderia pseudomallei Pakistan 9]|nr:conserved hypothetical protein [Burkholderia pseudomallei Pakistan 9]
MRRVSARRSPNVREARMSGNGCVNLYRRAAHRPRADRKGRRPKTGGRRGRQPVHGRAPAACPGLG